MNVYSIAPLPPDTHTHLTNTSQTPHIHTHTQFSVLIALKFDVSNIKKSVSNDGTLGIHLLKCEVNVRSILPGYQTCGKQDLTRFFTVLVVLTVKLTK